MFETGVGRLLNLDFAAHLPKAKAHDLSPSARYFKEDIISPEVTMDQGFIEVEAMKKCEVLDSRIKTFAQEEILFDLV